MKKQGYKKIYTLSATISIILLIFTQAGVAHEDGRMYVSDDAGGPTHSITGDIDVDWTPYDRGDGYVYISIDTDGDGDVDSVLKFWIDDSRVEDDLRHADGGWATLKFKYKNGRRVLTGVQEVAEPE